jgi:hypothetical protein
VLCGCGVGLVFYYVIPEPLREADSDAAACRKFALANINRGRRQRSRRLIYLHIGRHKTGTTAVQRFLTRNRKRLETFGLIYPPTSGSFIAHHAAALAVDALRFRKANEQQRARAKEELANIKQLISNGSGSLVISSEAFQNLRPQMIAKAFPPGQTTVIVYLREQLDYMLSSYSQMLKAQHTRKTLKEYASGFRPNYCKFVSSWVSAFGRNAVRPRIYDRSSLIGGDIRQDFAQQIGIDDICEFELPPSDPNLSLGSELIEFKGLLNAFVPRDVQSKLKIYKLLQALAKRFPPDIGLSEEFALEYRQQFTETNSKLFAEFFDCSETEFNFKKFPVRSDRVELMDLLEKVLAVLGETAPGRARLLRGYLPKYISKDAIPTLLPD